MAYYYFHSKRMGKRAIIDEATDSDEDGDYETETVLIFKVHHAEGIDEPRPLDSHYTRFYRVYGWINPGENKQAYTHGTYGRPNPSWNMEFCLRVVDFYRSDGKFLHLEVVRIDQEKSKEPGPSNQEVLVGRTRIPLTSALFKGKSGMFQLVRLDEVESKSAGCIRVSMQLKKSYIL